MLRVNGDGLDSVGGRQDPIAEGQKHVAGNAKNRAFVIDDQDRLPVAAGQPDRLSLAMRGLAAGFGGQVDLKNRALADPVVKLDQSTWTFVLSLSLGWAMTVYI